MQKRSKLIEQMNRLIDDDFCPFGESLSSALIYLMPSAKSFLVPCPSLVFAVPLICQYYALKNSGIIHPCNWRMKKYLERTGQMQSERNCCLEELEREQEEKDSDL